MKFVIVYYIFYFLLFPLRNYLNQDFVAFLNVGQGDAIFLSNGALKGLIDGGPDYSLDYFIDNRVPFFSCHINFILATHPHKDHIAGLSRILKRCRVDKVIVNYIDYESKEWKHFITLSQLNSTLYKYPNLTRIQKNDLNIFLFAKDKIYCQSDINLCSILTFLEFKQTRGGSTTFLLTGDLNSLTQLELFSKHIDILKVAHHGGADTVSEHLLNTYYPKLAVLSYGIPNKYNHPASQTINILNKRGVKFVDTTKSSVLVKVPR